MPTTDEGNSVPMSATDKFLAGEGSKRTHKVRKAEDELYYGSYITQALYEEIKTMFEQNGSTIVSSSQELIKYALLKKKQELA